MVEKIKPEFAAMAQPGMNTGLSDECGSVLLAGDVGSSPTRGTYLMSMAYVFIFTFNGV